MDHKHYLLPHSFQRVGWALLICVPILLGLVPWVFNDLKLIPQHYSRYGTLVLEIVAALSAFFVGLSEEKQEDEFIQSIRLRSIANTAWICFTLMILLILAECVCVAFRVSTPPVHRMFGSLIFAFFVYIVIFRYRLFKYRKEASHEE